MRQFTKIIVALAALALSMSFAAATATATATGKENCKDKPVPIQSIHRRIHGHGRKHHHRKKSSNVKQLSPRQKFNNGWDLASWYGGEAGKQNDFGLLDWFMNGKQKTQETPLETSPGPDLSYFGSQSDAQEKKDAGSPSSSKTTTSSEKEKDTTTTASSFKETILALHNVHRAKHGVALMHWDKDAESAAQEWAKQCVFEHTPNNPYGQNLAISGGTQFGADETVTMWYDEINKYNFQHAGFSLQTGHFTQMVWKGSTGLGCARVQCQANQLGLGTSGPAINVVCHYSPYGNVIGEFDQNVFPPR